MNESDLRHEQWLRLACNESGLAQKQADANANKFALLAACKAFLDWDNNTQSLDVPTELRNQIARAVHLNDG